MDRFGFFAKKYFCFQATDSAKHQALEISCSKHELFPKLMRQ